MEAQWPAAVIEALKAMGHKPTVQPIDSLDFGSAQLIARIESDDGDTAAYVGGSDTRRDGMVIGY